MFKQHRPDSEDTCWMRSSHGLDRLDVAFDGAQLVADAGLHLPATLAERLGLRRLVDDLVDLGQAPGRANPGDKILTLVLSALAGGDCIDDANALRAGGTGRVLGFVVKTSSTDEGTSISFILDVGSTPVTIWIMMLIRVSTIDAPLDEPLLVDPVIGLVRRAVALGLLAGSEPLEHLDLELVRRIAREASAVGIGQDAAVALLHGGDRPEGLATLIARLDDAFTASPLPDRELPELLRVFDRDDLADLIGTSAVSLGRYQAGSRRWPDQLADRLHWLALVIADLAGAYNEFGIRRWFERRRTQLGDRSPREVLGRDWDPGDPEVERARELAAALVGAGTAT